MKIVSKTLVVYPEPIPVYDLTSPGYENFVLASGAVVHNCKRARNKKFQAIYPMRGKPLNVMEKAKEKINSNTEVVGLLAALDIDLNSKRAEAPKIRYGKVITMADPDVDGKHITCLCLAILWKYTPHLIRNGNVFVIKAPLYKSKHKGEVYFGMTKEDIYKQTKTEKCDITYIKGWGEVNEEDLGVALDPNKRTLYKVAPPTDKGKFELLMGKKPEFRKKLFKVQ